MLLLSFPRELAPIKAAVLPLLKNRPEIVELAKKIYQDLRRSFACVYDDTAAIGKLYRRQDEVGTLFALRWTCSHWKTGRLQCGIGIR